MIVYYNACKRYCNWSCKCWFAHWKEVEVFVVCDNIPPSITRATIYGLWKFATIVCFCPSAKQPLSPLERFKCLDHGWVHAQYCVHKHIDGCLENKVHFYLCWWGYLWTPNLSWVFMCTLLMVWSATLFYWPWNN
jgi:hypothetical protein